MKQAEAAAPTSFFIFFCFLQHSVIKGKDKNERRFDRSTIIFKFEFADKNPALYLQL